MPDANWWRSFLKGQARACERRNVTRRALAGGIAAAVHAGVPVDEINEILGEFCLIWDAETGEVSERTNERQTH